MQCAYFVHTSQCTLPTVRVQEQTHCTLPGIVWTQHTYTAEPPAAQATLASICPHVYTAVHIFNVFWWTQHFAQWTLHSFGTHRSHCKVSLLCTQTAQSTQCTQTQCAAKYGGSQQSEHYTFCNAQWALQELGTCHTGKESNAAKILKSPATKVPAASIGDDDHFGNIDDFDIQ